MNKLILLTSLTLMIVACQKNESTTTGNPLVSLSVGASSQAAANVAKSFFEKIFFLSVPKSQALPPPSNVLDSQDRTVVLDHAWISIGEIEFKPTETADSSEVDGDSIEFHGPYTIDLYSATNERLGSAQVPSGPIRRIKTKLSQVLSLPSGAPANLMNNSIFISASVNGNSFEFISDDEVEFEVGGPTALNITSDSNILLTFKIADMIKKINLGSISNGAQISQSQPISAINPCPLIDNSAADLYTCFRKGLEDMANLGKDDGDGELESDEESVR